MSSSPSLLPNRAELEARALAAERQGRFSEALAAWAELLTVAPDHVRALTATGYDARRRGDLELARDCLSRAARSAGKDPVPWVNLARLSREQGDEAGEEEALLEALRLDPHDLLALLMRGELHERRGQLPKAVQAYTAAVTVAPPKDQLRPDLHSRVAHAAAVRDRYNRSLADHLDAAMSRAAADLSAAESDRFRLSLDIMLGRKQRYESRPSQFLVPHLAPVEFFDRAQFPWLDEIEAGTDEIRQEFLAAWQADEGFRPYLTYSADKPVNQFGELNNSTRWSAYHLIKDGCVQAAAAARCPRTMELLSRAPQPEQPGRTPAALFSLLKPHTRIPPHTGVSNARVLVHLPLIVPPGCGFRVGNQIREWLPGHALIFDDTIEHEAWNDSDQLRVVLIFDIWHPALSESERRLITAMTQAINEFAGMPEGYGT
jgi:aspartyl/asparaginyl beta-hydroxylase (cupin superfamily)